MRRAALYLAVSIVAGSLAGTATAQMMGGGMGNGGHGGGGMGSGGSTGGSGGVGMGSGMGSGGGMDMGLGSGMNASGRLIVSAGGTAFVLSRRPSTSGSPTLLAIGPNGSTAWAWDAAAPIHDLALAGDLVIVAGSAMTHDGTTGSGTPNELVALRAATGAVAWRLSLGGAPMRLEALSDRILALVAKASVSTSGSGTGGHMGSGDAGDHGMSRSLVAVDLLGRLLWTVDLDE